MRKSTEELTLAAATALTMNHGASMAELAAALGISRATLHRAFPSRDELIGRIVADSEDAFDAAVTLAEGAEPGERFLRLAEELWPVADRFSFLMSYPDVGDQERTDAVFQRVRLIIEQEQAAGLLRRDVSPAWIAEALAGLLWSAARAVHEGTVARADAVRLLVSTVMVGLAHTLHE